MGQDVEMPPQSRDEKIGVRQIELLEAILAELQDIRARLPAPIDPGGETSGGEEEATGSAGTARGEYSQGR